MTDTYIEKESARYARELHMLREFPEEELAAIIREVGFSCTQCSNCCTTTQNGHVFLLDCDTEKAMKICPDALIPAPFFEICDRSGNFYVSGYALRAHRDGTCIHLTNKRCCLYEDRFSICRVYPYMLHREPDERGNLTFRQISGLNEHGEYHTHMSEEKSRLLARETIRYEEAWLLQMISFFETVKTTFQDRGDRHVRKIYDQQIKKFKSGEPIVVYVFYNTKFYPHTITKEDYIGIPIP